VRFQHARLSTDMTTKPRMGAYSPCSGTGSLPHDGVKWRDRVIAVRPVDGSAAGCERWASDPIASLY